MVLISIIESLKGIDNNILLWVNSRHSDTLDTVMWNASDRFAWIPLYVIMLYLVTKKYGKASWIPIVCVIIAIVISDQVSNHLFKNIVMRYRPSHNLMLQNQLHYVRNYTGGLYGFASSHAANSMAFAVLMYALFPKKYIAALLTFYVVLVCYSRVYLGVHYPSDIFGGIIIGILAGMIGYIIYTFLGKRFIPADTQ